MNANEVVGTMVNYGIYGAGLLVVVYAVAVGFWEVGGQMVRAAVNRLRQDSPAILSNRNSGGGNRSTRAVAPDTAFVRE